MLDMSILEINHTLVKRKICNFIKRKTSAHDGVVLGLSGGIDSALCAKLCVDALGSEKVHALILPSEFTSGSDLSDAKDMAKGLGILVKEISIQPILDSFLAQVPDGLFTTKLAKGNIQARIRMTLLYNEANSMNRLVIGTGNRSELMQGYFTKYGDGGCDMLPIGNLYKTQVRSLAKYLGINERILAKKPSAGLWPGQSDEADLGVSYEQLDRILYAYLEKRMPASKIAGVVGVDKELADRVIENIRKNKHKRELPPMPELVTE